MQGVHKYPSPCVKKRFQRSDCCGVKGKRKADDYMTLQVRSLVHVYSYVYALIRMCDVCVGVISSILNKSYSIISVLLHDIILFLFCISTLINAMYVINASEEVSICTLVFRMCERCVAYLICQFASSNISITIFNVMFMIFHSTYFLTIITQFITIHLFHF